VSKKPGRFTGTTLWKLKGEAALRLITLSPGIYTDHANQNIPMFEQECLGHVIAKEAPERMRPIPSLASRP
jgi:hypothetical protein